MAMVVSAVLLPPALYILPFIIHPTHDKFRAPNEKIEGAPTSIYVCVFHSSICRRFRRQQMTKPSPCIFEASSVKTCDERTGAFSHHLDERQVSEMWVGLTCANFSVGCFRIKATFKTEARSSLLTNPHILVSRVW